MDVGRWVCQSPVTLVAIYRIVSKSSVWPLKFWWRKNCFLQTHTGRDNRMDPNNEICTRTSSRLILICTLRKSWHFLFLHILHVGHKLPFWEWLSPTRLQLGVWNCSEQRQITAFICKKKCCFAVMVSSVYWSQKAIPSIVNMCRAFADDARCEEAFQIGKQTANDCSVFHRYNRLLPPLPISFFDWNKFNLFFLNNSQ